MAQGILSLLTSRRTTYEYANRQVGDSDLMAVLEAARWSPSFLNLQPWQFIIIKNKEMIKKLLEQAYYGVYHCNDYECRPPAIIAIVMKKKYYEGQYGYPRRDKPGIFEAHLSISMPAMNMVLAAHERGLASCILNVNVQQASRLLGLSGGDTIPLIVCLGYARPGDKSPRKPRKNLESLLYYEKHGNRK